MPAQWTGTIVGEMHIHGITGKMLADRLGWHPKYLSQVLNSANPPEKAESKIRTALDWLIHNQSN